MAKRWRRWEALVGIFVLGAAIVGGSLLISSNADEGADAGEVALSSESGNDRAAGDRVGQAGRDTHTAAETESPSVAEMESSSEVEARAQAEKFYRLIAADSRSSKNDTEVDTEAFCGLMSEGAIKETIAYVHRGSRLAKRWNCESATRVLILRSKRTGSFGSVRNAQIIGVNVDGDAATATIQFGHGPATTVPLVREADEWKLGSTPTG